MGGEGGVIRGEGEEARKIREREKKKTARGGKKGGGKERR